MAEQKQVAEEKKRKTSPGEFFNQVRAETEQDRLADPRGDRPHGDLRVHLHADPVAVLPRHRQRVRHDRALRDRPACSKAPSCVSRGAPRSDDISKDIPMARWYIIHAYSGFENKVRDAIISEAERLGLSDGRRGSAGSRPRPVTEVKRGKKVQVERKFMPGYVLAKLNMTDDVYHLVKNTPKVTGFLGSGNKPQPISEKEAARYFGGVAEAQATPKRDISVDYEIGDSVKVLDGPVRKLQRDRGGARFRQGQGQGQRVDLRPRDPGRAGLRTGRTGEVVDLLCACPPPRARPRRCSSVASLLRAPAGGRSALRLRDEAGSCAKLQWGVTGFHENPALASVGGQAPLCHSRRGGGCGRALACGGSLAHLQVRAVPSVSTSPAEPKGYVRRAPEGQRAEFSYLLRRLYGGACARFARPLSLTRRLFPKGGRVTVCCGDGF